MRVKRLVRSLHESGVVAQAQVVIGAEVEDTVIPLDRCQFTYANLRDEVYSIVRKCSC